MDPLTILATIATVAKAGSDLKNAFGDKGGGVGSAASADTQTGRGLEYIPVGLESLDITFRIRSFRRFV